MSRVRTILLICAAMLAGPTLVGWPIAADAAHSHHERHNAHASRTISHDGNWSVLIVTKRGTCDSGYRFLLGVSNGRIRYEGGGPVSVSGTVSHGGYVHVSIRSSGKGALGHGRLLGTAGRGTWSGRGSNGPCAGYWEAEKR